MAQRALVLGAGGPAACAWETGLIVGMAESGLDVRDADLSVGTSAGSRVAVQLNSALTLEELFQRQVDPRHQAKGLPATIDFKKLKDDIARAKQGPGGTREILQRVGALASAASKVSESEQRKEIASQLPIHTWPDARILVVAVDAQSGERRVFDRTSGVPLIDAVAASCAAPGMSPTITIEDRRYMDGGTYSTENADLAARFERVLILALRARVPSFALVSLDIALETLQGNGVQVAVVHPDEVTEAAFAAVGGNLLDPSVREGAVRAGREQGRQIAGGIGPLWRLEEFTHVQHGS